MSVATSPALDRRAGLASGRARAGAAAAVAAGALMLAEFVVAVTASGDLHDHSTGAGRLSEGLVGLAFVAGALALACWVPDGGLVQRLLCLPAVIGAAATGAVMLLITATGEEVSESITTVVVLVTLVGLVVHGLVGWRARTWPLWAGLALGALMLVMFLVPNPANSAVMALTWLAVAAAVWRR